MSSIKFSVFFILVIFLSFGINTSSKISNFSSNTKRKLVENLDSVAICLDAKSKIYLDFNLDKKSKKEYIENIELIKKVEDDEAYSFVFLVKSLRNIGDFKKYY